MRRRRLLAALPALLGGCLSNLPTATGPRSGPTPDGTPGERTGVVVADVDVEPTADDRLRVLATLRNRGPEPTDATVVVTVTVAGEESVRESTVRVPGGATVETSVAFDATFDAFTGDGSVSARVR
jgi:hypothetical protein